jgi:hypothetical protein
MKDVKLLDREQAVFTFNISLILAAIQEHALKSEPASINHTNNSKQFFIELLRESLTI